MAERDMVRNKTLRDGVRSHKSRGEAEGFMTPDPIPRGFISDPYPSQP